MRQSVAQTQVLRESRHFHSSFAAPGVDPQRAVLGQHATAAAASHRGRAQGGRLLFHYNRINGLIRCDEEGFSVARGLLSLSGPLSGCAS